MLARGARTVVASLWPVPDEIGARLMTEFYKHMHQEDMGSEAALSAAMRSLAQRKRSSHPALWAAFRSFYDHSGWLGGPTAKRDESGQENQALAGRRQSGWSSRCLWPYRPTN